MTSTQDLQNLLNNIDINQYLPEAYVDLAFQYQMPPILLFIAMLVLFFGIFFFAISKAFERDMTSESPTRKALIAIAASASLLSAYFIGPFLIVIGGLFIFFIMFAFLIIITTLSITIIRDPGRDIPTKIISIFIILGILAFIFFTAPISIIFLIIAGIFVLLFLLFKYLFESTRPRPQQPGRQHQAGQPQQNTRHPPSPPPAPQQHPPGQPQQSLPPQQPAQGPHHPQQPQQAVHIRPVQPPPLGRPLTVTVYHYPPPISHFSNINMKIEPSFIDKKILHKLTESIHKMDNQFKELSKKMEDLENDIKRFFKALYEYTSVYSDPHKINYHHIENLRKDLNENIRKKVNEILRILGKINRTYKEEIRETLGDDINSIERELNKWVEELNRLIHTVNDIYNYFEHNINEIEKKYGVHLNNTKEINNVKLFINTSLKGNLNKLRDEMSRDLRK